MQRERKRRFGVNAIISRWWWRWRRNVSFSLSASLSLFSALTLSSHPHLWSLKLSLNMLHRLHRCLCSPICLGVMRATVFMIDSPTQNCLNSLGAAEEPQVSSPYSLTRSHHLAWQCPTLEPPHLLSLAYAVPSQQAFAGPVGGAQFLLQAETPRSFLRPRFCKVHCAMIGHAPAWPLSTHETKASIRMQSRICSKSKWENTTC